MKKKLYVFTGKNCINCEALKPQLKELDKDKFDICYFDFDDDEQTNNFSKYRVRGIPTVFEINGNKEVDKTRQAGVIDLTRYLI